MISSRVFRCLEKPFRTKSQGPFFLKLTSEMCNFSKQARSLYSAAPKTNQNFESRSNGLIINSLQKRCVLLGHKYQHPCNLIIKRTLHNFYRKIFKKKSLQEYQKKDCVEPHYNLIYQGGAAPYAAAALGIVDSVGLVLCGLGVNYGSKLLYGLILSNVYELGMFVGFNVLLCVSVFRVSRMYTLRVYYSELEDKFIIVTLGLHPFALSKAVIRSGEVTSASVSKVAELLLPWSHDIYNVSSQKVIIHPYGFLSPSYFNKMMGYEQ